MPDAERCRRSEHDLVVRFLICDIEATEITSVYSSTTCSQISPPLPQRSYLLPYPNDDAVGVVWQFPNSTWIENLAVRQTGEILASSLSRYALYQVDPFSHTESTIAEFGGDGVLGIAEVENDVFIVVTAKVNLATSVATPGSAKAWKVDMAAWSLVRPLAFCFLVSDSI